MTEQQQRQSDQLPPFSKLMKHIPEWTEEGWLEFLYRNGLKPLHSMTKKDVAIWYRKLAIPQIEKHFKQLCQTFSGPDVDIFIFPIDQNNTWLMKNLKGKNGLSFPNFILLFIGEHLTLNEKLALLTHEYHHVCRLHHQKNSEATVSLLESMIMEGLAENEVKRMVGKQYLAPWTKVYTIEEVKHWWRYLLSNKKDVIGRNNHQIYMFGEKFGIPKWIGYAAGYEIVKSYVEQNNKKADPQTLLKIKANELFQRSTLVKLDVI